MRVDGQEIAQKIFNDLKQRVDKLKGKGITPHLHIITLTSNFASKVYVSQKKLKGKRIGAKITVENLDPQITTQDLLKKIHKLNNDSSIHGVIVQRPLPFQIDEKKTAEAINPRKDVDGFHQYSDFSPPVGISVLKILEKIYNSFEENLNFEGWLKSKKITVVGGGITAGKPIIKTLVRIGVKPLTVASQTQNRAEILKNSDIIICAVGKPNILTKSDIKKGAILVGVGMFMGKDGKFHSDYEEEDIKDTASFYTPTPGGVGPVNVAELLSNLLNATEN
ncbi:MAG: hypothetical protein A2958_02655 [Candidatus Levybacteria bacterium RIFCSPLOWO2_01_FULL_38_13]|nr:MAG: hypothetical protein A2629_03075 [Candidatus Levybacteria bacterium RIFCSPHIGHO2_01_FULL_41_15]OGH35238.1 MAG: hypothetical protein A2958_02655 [Candidatus Levybacteria bacterium RIFCSPLOWO2_01_FULL_38_13]